MSVEEIKSRLQAELPLLLREDAGFRRWLEDLIRSTAVTPESFDARFDRLLNELAADREEQARKRADQERKWDEQWTGEGRKWEAQERKWEAQERKWDEQTRFNFQLLDELRQTRLRQEQGIGALGARWGLASEASFRDALKGILEKSFGVEVINVNEFDDEGTVFGTPDQVEIDVIIRNGELILCELKSSMSKSDIYTFERKVLYYQRRHGRTATRKLVISPMVRPEARPVAERLGIEVFGCADGVTGLATT
ncbi:DUF3782 domain-containing protein [uncultured Thiodictyon sp.]|jgi:hypothetical protein|uniref:PD-(D/E)XK nuclease family protein n=1 Tax=uncultured Thiodictyon sp. TaxID=1846217 RepID=UPI0025E20C02|nr:DUF3782 domain-containing protein [uncultured Thiodictyon sp.]